MPHNRPTNLEVPDMLKRTLVAATLAVALLVPGLSRAHSAGVGMGVSFGVVLPKSEILEMSDAGFAWGFWVDIPIAWKFYITPSAQLYNLGGKVGENPATDIDLNFKFILPVSFAKIYFGAAGGATVHAEYDANVGLFLGSSFNLVSGLDVFVQGKYKLVIDDPNIHMVHVDGGFMYWF
ncbi:MAG: hypothetical protein AMXMBFR64_27910 [Myxococcales bacterium]